MEDQEDRKNRRKFTEKKVQKDFRDKIECKNSKHQKYAYKNKKEYMEQDELWEEWQDYYK